ncbi:LOW QUALITY PROTEIN: ataxin-2-like protein [Scomber scombrus]|uniref:LOW QUALITY PROTEIN: ataxin-2-like protein n=1 Tax=Scomber scombrus TaxID=13677 RepID=A0AAV1Q749_SCOSC
MDARSESFLLLTQLLARRLTQLLTRRLTQLLAVFLGLSNRVCDFSCWDDDGSGSTGMHMTKKTRSTMKPPSQTQSSAVSSLIFEGVYNNARMLHFLTAVVGSTCDVRVKNGAVYEGIFKTLSSQCELAVDAVHKRSDGDEGGGGEEGGGGGGGGGGSSQSSSPKIEDITDTMIFSPADLVTMTCRDVDLSFAVRDTFTDTAISSSRVNGEHREKVLQRWDGDGNGENFELETDASNGWDANDMFKFNEEAYGVKSTYDSSLSMYTMPLEKGTSDVYRQREARAARLANEIEGSVQYRRRVSLENDEGRSEEDRYSSVVREKEDRSSPGFSSGREGKYIPLPQRAREIGLSSGRGAASSGRGAGPSSSSRHPPPSSSSPKPASDRSSPLSVRTAYSPHQSQASPPAAGSPPCSNHALTHSMSHPQALADTSRSSVNGVVSRTSPKSQRLQSSRTLRTPNSQSTPAVSRAPKPDAPPPQDVPLAGPAYLDSSSSSSTVTAATTTKPSGPTPLFNVDVNEILSSAAKERTESVSSQEGKKAPTLQQRSQLEELRKFGKEFRLQPSSSPSASPSSADPPPPADSSSSSAAPPKPVASLLASSAQDLQQPTDPAPSPTSTPPAPGAAPAGPQSTEGTQPAPPSSGGEEACAESGESVAVAATQVKNSTLNPNAKEFLPIKGNKPAPTPTPPRHQPSPSPLILTPQGQPGGGGAIYSSPPGHYLSYMSPISIQGHSIQAPQLYQYTMPAVNQGKFPRGKGPVVGPRQDHHASPANPMISAAASAAGPPLVASPYPQSYLQYGQVIQAMPPHYHGQPMYQMLQGGARMLTSGAPPQPMGPPGPQYPGQAEGPPGPQQAMYAQSFSHHSGAIHHPQPSSTPTGNQPQPQHTAPSPGHNQSGQAGPQAQSMFHSAGLSAPTPPNMQPGHSSPQASYTMQGYSLPTHQLPHGFPSISQLTQAHVSAGISGPHHSAGHGPPVMLHYAPPQQGGGSNPQHGPPPQQGAPQHFYIGHPQALQVQAHHAQQLSFHHSAN